MKVCNAYIDDAEPGDGEAEVGVRDQKGRVVLTNLKSTQPETTPSTLRTIIVIACTSAGTAGSKHVCMPVGGHSGRTSGGIQLRGVRHAQIYLCKKKTTATDTHRPQ